jgi:hypothetical protein
MKNPETTAAFSDRTPSTATVEPIDQEQLLEQLKSAYPTATERLLVSALEECRKESKSPNDPEKLIRCVIERITS